MEKKGDLRDFEPDVVVGARRVGLHISQTADPLELSPHLSHLEGLLATV